ncbi:MAG: hypothetical protein HZA93_05785 [Verrucomicrobia bacterium]|nr:hypothetical protein [Verrucomicrobiota bacterium]
MSFKGKRLKRIAKLLAGFIATLIITVRSNCAEQNWATVTIVCDPIELAAMLGGSAQLPAERLERAKIRCTQVLQSSDFVQKVSGRVDYFLKTKNSNLAGKRADPSAAGGEIRALMTEDGRQLTIHTIHSNPETVSLMARYAVDEYLELIGEQVSNPGEHRKKRVALTRAGPARTAFDEADARVRDFKRAHPDETSSELEAEANKRRAEYMSIMNQLNTMGSRPFVRTFVRKIEWPDGARKEKTK